MKLLCVGGPKDGERIELPDDRIGVPVRTYPAFCSSEQPTETIYQRMTFIAGSQVFLFLAPESQTMQQSVALLLENYSGGGMSHFQADVSRWLVNCFGQKIAADEKERNHRFLEESLELVQSCGCTQSEAHQLVDYVYGRPQGRPIQELGGVMVTLAALCYGQRLDLEFAADLELQRILDPDTMERIRIKQASKPAHSPLPQ